MTDPSSAAKGLADELARLLRTAKDWDLEINAWEIALRVQACIDNAVLTAIASNAKPPPADCVSDVGQMRLGDAVVARFGPGWILPFPGGLPTQRVYVAILEEKEALGEGAAVPDDSPATGDPV